MVRLALFLGGAIAATVAFAEAPPPADASPADPSPAVTTTDAPPPAATPMSAEAIAHDPRMIAAIRHANATADRKCGEGVGGSVDLATKAEAARCRRRMIATAKLDAESEIAGH